MEKHLLNWYLVHKLSKDEGGGTRKENTDHTAINDKQLDTQKVQTPEEVQLLGYEWL